MALGTLTLRGQDRRNANTNLLTLDVTWTSAADELVFLMVNTENGGPPTTITGHDGGSSWIQVGSTETQSGHDMELWGAISSGTSSTAITVANTVSGRMTVNAFSITGADTSGTVANAFEQIGQNSGYTGSPSITFGNTATKETILFLGIYSVANYTVDSPLVEIVDYAGVYNNVIQVVGAVDSGDTTPGATRDDPGNSNLSWFAVEIKEAAGGANTLVAESVSYTYTPTAIELQRGLKLVTESVSYAYAPTAIDLDHGRTLVTESVSYSYTPTAITLTFAGVGSFTLTAESVGYTYTATAIDFQVGHVLVTESVSYVNSITTIDLQVGRVLVTETVPYTYSVTAAGLDHGRTLTAESVAYTYTATAIGLLTGRVLNAESVGYTYSVSALTLNASGQVWTVQSDASTTWTAQTNSSTTWTVQ